MSRPIRVLVNALHAKSGGGVTYLNALLPHLEKRKDIEVHLLVHQSQTGLASLAASSGRLYIARFRDGFFCRLLWEQLVLPIIAWTRADVTLSPANFGPFLAPRPVVLLRNSLEVAKHEPRLKKKLYWLFLRVATWLSLFVAPRAAAVSAYAARQLSMGFAPKVEVIPHGVDHARFFHFAGKRDDFILAVGDLTVQKNFSTLIEAVAGLDGVSLQIAGRETDAAYADHLARLVRALGVSERISFLGPVSGDELAGLYRRCAVFAFPSTVETFGNPLVEAMACGCPIVSSNATAMPETLANAAVLINPFDVDEWRHALDAVLKDKNLQADLSGRSLARARDFSWEATARRTMALLIAAAKRPASPILAFMGWLWVTLVLGAYLAQFRHIAPTLLQLLQ